MPVCRLLFRLDFKRVNTDIVDRPGKVMKMLLDAPEQFWSGISDQAQNRTITARHTAADGRAYRHLSVEPTVLSGLIETSAGIPLKELEKDDIFDTLAATVTNLCSEFKISDLARFGFRAICLDKIGMNKSGVANAFRSYFEPSVIERTEDSLGPITDYGMAFDGASRDQVSYHFKCGPFDSSETSKYFEQINEIASDFDTIWDIDLYETDLALERVAFDRWCRPYIAKMDKAVHETTRILKKTVEELPHG